VSVVPLVTASAVLAQAVPNAIRQAYTSLDRGAINQAIAQFERALQQYPQSVEGLLGLAIAYRRAGRDADAFRTYQRVIEIDPNNRLALGALGVLGGYRPEWQNQGIEALNRLISLDSSDVNARAQRALLFVYQGRFGEAIADYEIVLRNNPTPTVVLGAAQAYTYAGNYARGLELFGRYQSAGGSLGPNEAIAYALALRETGRASQAVQILEAQLRQSRELDSTAINLRGALASLYAASGQFSQAVQVVSPLQGRQDSRMVLARAYNDLGRYSGNAAYYQAAADLYRQILGQGTGVTAGLAREIADALSGMPLPSERQYALEVYRQLAAQYPNDVSLQVQQAVLERQIGQISSSELQQRLQTLLQPVPSNPFEQRAIAQALIRLDPPDPSLLPIYQSLINAGINEPFLNFRVAQIYIQQGNASAAQNALAAYAATPLGQQDQGSIVLLQTELDRRSGNLEAAAQRYQRLIASNPDPQTLSGALQGLASIRQAQGRLQEAIALYDQVLALNPQDPAKQLGRASLAYQANIISQAQAEAILNSWLSTYGLSATPPELYSLAGALPANPDREDLYTALVNADPNNIPIQLRRLQLVARRSPDLARSQLQRLIAQNPDDFNIYFIQGELAQDLDNLDLASDAYESILSQEPSNIGALLALGGVRFQQRQYDSAAQLYNQALAIDPNNSIAMTSLVGLTVVQGRRLDALSQLEQLQVDMSAAGQSTDEISREMQRIREGYLQQRGFQPEWERY
jgi:tetratricopeptide (TPR) repeat protein